MRKNIMGADGPVVWISTGALTNLAILIQICPEILTKISLVSLMGGAIGKGNKTPAA
jgi:inosine-uridine nucleoside N-ribohydrolase